MIDHRIPVILATNDNVGGVQTWAYRLQKVLSNHPRYNVLVLGGKGTLSGYQKFDLHIPNEASAYNVLAELAPAIVVPNNIWYLYPVIADLLDANHKIRCLGFCRTDNEYEYYRPLSWFEPLISSFAVVSPECKHKLAKWIPARAKEISVLPTSVFVPDKLERHYHSSPVRLVYAGRIVQTQKRVLDFVPLVRNLVKHEINFSLDFVGQGTEEGKLKELLQEHIIKQKVRFQGRVAPENMNKVWKEHDIFIQLSEFEGTSNSMLEAMAQGTVPVVTQTESGLAGVIEPGKNGFVVPLKDMDTLANLIRRLATEPNLLESVGRSAYETAKKFSIHSYAENFSLVLDQTQEKPIRTWPKEKPILPNFEIPGITPKSLKISEEYKTRTKQNKDLKTKSAYRILMVSNFYPPFNLGGYELRCAMVAQALQQKGHEVRVVTSSYGINKPSKKFQFLEGIEVYRILREHKHSHPIRSRFEKISALYHEFVDILHFYNIVKEFKPDVINWWNVIGLTEGILPISKHLGIPDVFWIEDVWIAELGWHKKFWEGKFINKRLRPFWNLIVCLLKKYLQWRRIPLQQNTITSDYAIYISEFQRNVNSSISNIKFKDSSVVYGGIPVDKFQYTRNWQTIISSHSPLRMLYVGAVTVSRRLHIVLDALELMTSEQLRKFKLSVVGTPPVSKHEPYYSELVKRVSTGKLKDCVTFCGYISYDKMPTIYIDHHVLIFPSARPEGFPLSMVEAMMTGCCVLTTGSGGAGEIAKIANLPLFDLDNPLELKNQLLHLDGNRQWMIECAQRGQEVALKKFSFREMIYRFEQILADLVKKPSNTSKLQNLHQILLTDNKNSFKFVICGINSANAYSGGRYHAWLMAEALVSLGHQGTVWTNNIPVFLDDLKNLSGHESLRVQVSPNFQDLPTGPFDVVIVVPHRSDADHFYKKALYLASIHQARTVLLNFESPNWFNALSPEPREEALWKNWVKVSKVSDMILSLTREGTHFAREYYTDTIPGTIFRHCYPTINSQAADAAEPIPHRRQVICITRFGKNNQHKGGQELLKAVGPALKDYTLALVIGSGPIDPVLDKELQQKAKKYNITLRYLHQVTDEEKFREIKSSSLMLFLSFFEGYGIPVVESLYCDIPCIVYELPVLREFGGEALIYVPPGDEEKLQEAIHLVLSGQYRPPVKLSEYIAPLAQFTDFAHRLDILMQELITLPTEPTITKISSETQQEWRNLFFVPTIQAEVSPPRSKEKTNGSARLLIPGNPIYQTLKKIYHRLVPLSIRLWLRDFRQNRLRPLYHRIVPLQVRLQLRNLRVRLIGR